MRFQTLSLMSLGKLGFNGPRKSLNIAWSCWCQLLPRQITVDGQTCAIGGKAPSAAWHRHNGIGWFPVSMFDPAHIRGESHVCGWGVVSLAFFWMDGFRMLRPMCYALGHDSRPSRWSLQNIWGELQWNRQKRPVVSVSPHSTWLNCFRTLALRSFASIAPILQEMVWTLTIVFSLLVAIVFFFWPTQRQTQHAGHVAGGSGTTLQIRKDCKSFGWLMIDDSKSFAFFFCNHQFTECLGRHLGTAWSSTQHSETTSCWEPQSQLVPRWSSRAIFLKKHGSHGSKFFTHQNGWYGWLNTENIWTWYKSTTNQPQINPYRCVMVCGSSKKNMTCGSSNRFSPVKDGDGHHTPSLRSTQTDRAGGRTSCDELHLGWPFLSHSDSYQSTLWILPLCHQVRGKTVSWFGSLAKTRLARLDVCRSLFSMLCITCSGEQIQPVEKVWCRMFWKLDPFYCAFYNFNPIVYHHAAHGQGHTLGGKKFLFIFRPTHIGVVYKICMNMHYISLMRHYMLLYKLYPYINIQ